MYSTNIEELLNPNNTNTSVNIVSYGFKMKYCREFIEKYINKPNYISSGKKIKDFFRRTMQSMRKHQDNVDELIMDLEECKSAKRSILLKILAKLIHIIPSIAVGPNILDPIIIEVNKETLTTIHKVVENYIYSPIRPIIILLLDKDSNIESIPEILKKFPVNLRVAIHNDFGKTEIISVLNNFGAENIQEFMDDYACQCFNSCCYTSDRIIIDGINDDDRTSIISKLFLKCHSSLLIDSKTTALKDINLINELLKTDKISPDILNLFNCINSLNTVYATDIGGENIVKAIKCSEEIDNPLITAFVNRYAHFIPNTTYSEKTELLYSAATEFEKRKMLDHKLYCTNNALTYSFYTDSLDLVKFYDMLAEAISNVPGIAGMSILYNNVGTALLYNRSPEEALNKYRTGLDFATNFNRPAQRIGLIGNLAISESLLGNKHSTDDLIKSANDIIYMPNAQTLPFIQINGLLNLLAVAIYENNRDAMNLIFNNDNFKNILKKALDPKCLGTGSLTTQLKVLSHKSRGLLDFSEYNLPKITSQISGIRQNYITENGFNPAIGNAWL